ncbi:hypothetical protein [Streptosporangium sp. NPDC000396]|uniref:hypothetical protein n=1 Tax=Streptosporangium sp. NPDC000396 TaxID=3366185 RepID=UPI003682026E
MNEPRESEDAGRASEEVIQAGNRAFESPPEDKEPGREISEEERQGISSTDTEPKGPFGVGESSTRRAEEVATREEEEGRQTAGVDEKTGRPYGTSAPESATGVEPQETAEEESPYIPPGDQAG